MRGRPAKKVTWSYKHRRINKAMMSHSLIIMIIKTHNAHYILTDMVTCFDNLFTLTTIEGVHKYKLVTPLSPWLPYYSKL